MVTIASTVVDDPVLVAQLEITLEVAPFQFKIYVPPPLPPPLPPPPPPPTYLIPPLNPLPPLPYPPLITPATPPSPTNLVEEESEEEVGEVVVAHKF